MMPRAFSPLGDYYEVGTLDLRYKSVNFRAGEGLERPELGDASRIGADFDRWRTILKLTIRLPGTNLSTLQQERARVAQVGGPK